MVSYNMGIIILASLTAFANAQDLFLATNDVFLAANAPDPRRQAKEMLAKMTLEEKVHMLHGNSSAAHPECTGYVGCIPKIDRLGIPALRLQDGPQGFRAADRTYDGTSTQWPSGMTMGMSWDGDLLERWGKAMGKEFYDKGANVLFGPAVNVHRVPTNGRNFEYISGEDPFLGKTLTRRAVEGIQSAGVIANVKHYIANNQEGQNWPGGSGAGDRHTTSSNLDERTAAEIYMKPYVGAIDGGVLSAMCGNNLVNGEHICENSEYQNVMLRKYNDFQGFICTDYRGGQSTLGAAFGGLDLQLPGCSQPDPSDPSGLTCKGQSQRPNYYGQPLLDAVRSNVIPQSILDEKVERILYAMYKSGTMSRTRQAKGDASVNVTSLQHDYLARSFATHTAVLLQNEGSLLPLPTNAKIAVIGTAGHDSIITGGGGSGRVAGPYSVSILDGLREALGADSVSYYGGNDTSEAAAVASRSSYAVVVLASMSQEGLDREDLALPHADLVAAVAAKQANTIVVVAAPGAFLAPWAGAVPSILSIFYNGQEQGQAVADLLLGKSSPSGKLTLTIPNKDNEIGLTSEQYPGVEFQGNCSIGWSTCYNETYSERLEVGYRWYHAHQVVPKFPFGHGLTYSTFELSNLMTNARNGVTISADVKNTGKRETAEVVQLYLTYPTSSNEPPRQLRGFEKVHLQPGEQKTVKWHFDRGAEDLSIWNVNTHSWEPQTGVRKVEVGTSSSNLPLQKSVKL